MKRKRSQTNGIWNSRPPQPGHPIQGENRRRPAWHFEKQSVLNYQSVRRFKSERNFPRNAPPCKGTCCALGLSPSLTFLCSCLARAGLLGASETKFPHFMFKPEFRKKYYDDSIISSSPSRADRLSRPRSICVHF
jgi:hypothetical protein